MEPKKGNRGGIGDCGEIGSQSDLDPKLGGSDPDSDAEGRKKSTYPGRDEPCMSNIERAVEMLKAKIDVIDFTPASKHQVFWP